MHTHIVVLGGGPGGYAAAFLAADEGLQVTLVNAEPQLGGTCLLRGCIPSKALLHVSRVMSEVDELGAEWGVSYGDPAIDLDAIRGRKEKIIRMLSQGLGQLAKRRKVQVIRAHASFLDSTTLSLEGDETSGGNEASIPAEGRLTFDHAVVATGSVPSMPASFQLDSDRVMDSTGALQLKDVPGSLLIIGGGYIGLEMGTVYAHLGSQVSVVELQDGLLPGADRDLVKPLHKRLHELFEGRIYLETKVGALGAHADHVEVGFEGAGKFGTERFDRVLVSVGRRPNTSGLGLENTQVRLDDRGFIQCDDQQRTNDPNILAIGDVAGEPMLAHKATHEGRIAVEVIQGRPARFDAQAIPAVVFTDPEIAWAGLTDTQAQQENRNVTTSIYPWAASGRAQALGRTEGLTKWIIDPETNRVLGCGIVGPGAGELIAEAVLAIEMGCEARDLTDSIHPHPTLSETVMNAAEVFYGTATEIYKPRRDKRT